MKPLSEAQARRCETACKPRCECRCGGALHGKARAGADATREWFERLPEDDPHHLPKKVEGRTMSITRDRWDAYRTLCLHCAGVDPSRPATLARACLEGARLLKDALAIEAQSRADRDGIIREKR